MAHLVSLSWEVSRQVSLRHIPPVVLVAFALGCSSGDMAAPEAAMVKAPKVVVTSLLDDGDGTCTGLKCTLRDAISTASAGTNVTFADNLCPRGATPTTGCKITLTSSQLSISKNLQILGSAGYILAVDGGGVVSPVLAVTSGAVATVRDLTISGSPLSGIVNQGTLTMKNVAVSGNGTANGSGGGIFNGRGGGVTLASSTVSGNMSAFGGGGIYNDNGSVTLSGSRVRGNTSGPGGGIFNLGGTLTVTNSTVSGNTAASSGGGIFNFSGGIVRLTNSAVSGNSAAADGGGIWTEGGSVTLSSSTISGNTGGSRGGGIFTNGPVTLLRRTCVNNNSTGITVSSAPWSPVNVDIFTFGTVTGLNCGVAQP